jgi:hypothetical protein
MCAMTTRRALIGAKPDAAERWVARHEAALAKAEIYTARLTVDVTPELRSRIKLAAFGRGLTVAEMLRALLEAQFPLCSDGAEKAP